MKNALIVCLSLIDFEVKTEIKQILNSLPFCKGERSVEAHSLDNSLTNKRELLILIFELKQEFQVKSLIIFTFYLTKVFRKEGVHRSKKKVQIFSEE